MAGIEHGQTDVTVAVDLTAFIQLHQHPGGITEIEHRQTPHLPEIVSGVRVVGELDVLRPVLAKAILHLSSNLLVGEIGQERKASLSHAHDLLLTSRRWPWGHSRACR